jgi:hypothetical protein
MIRRLGVPGDGNPTPKAALPTAFKCLTTLAFFMMLTVL